MVVQMKVRCEDVLQTRLEELAVSRGVSRNQLVVDELEALVGRGTTGGTTRPSGTTSGTTDLTPEARAALPVLQLSTSQLACLDQLAERAGVERVELMSRYLGERVRREFIEDRQRQMAGAKPRAGRKGAANAQENGQ